MLNNLVNNTGTTGTSISKKAICGLCCDVEKLGICVSCLEADVDLYSACLNRLGTVVDCASRSVSSPLVCADSIISGAVDTDGITADSGNIASLETSTVNASSITTGNLYGDYAEVDSIKTHTIDGLNSLTVDNIDASTLCTNNLVASAVHTSTLTGDNGTVSNLTSNCIATDCFSTDDAVIESLTSDNATLQCADIGVLTTNDLVTDEITTSKVNATTLSIPKTETSGGSTGVGYIDVSSQVWKTISTPLFSGTISFRGDGWQVSVQDGRLFTWEDESKTHLKYLRSDGNTVEIAVACTCCPVYYNYNVTQTEPVFTLGENTGTTPSDTCTFIMDNSGIPRGSALIYTDQAFTTQGLTILGKIQASNLNIEGSCSVECLGTNCLFIGRCIGNMDYDTPVVVCLNTEGVCITNYCEPVCLISDIVVVDSTVCANTLCYDRLQGTETNSTSSINIALYDSNSEKLCYNNNITFTDSCLETPNIKTCCVYGNPVVIGDLTINGNLYQCGSPYCTHAEQVYTCSDSIIMREGAVGAGAACIEVVKYDGTNDGVIELGSDGTLRIGDKNACQPVLTRSEAPYLSDNHILTWNHTYCCAQDSGFDIADVSTCDYVKTLAVCCTTATRDYADMLTTTCTACACEYTDTISLCTCDYTDVFTKGCVACACSYANLVASNCSISACDYASNRAANAETMACLYTTVKSIETDGVVQRCTACACAYAACTCIYANTKDVCVCNFVESCATASCTYANTVATSCKNAACTYAANCGSLARACACAFTVACVSGSTTDVGFLACCFGNSRNCVHYACGATYANQTYSAEHLSGDVTLVGASSGTYKLPLITAMPGSVVSKLCNSSYSYPLYQVNPGKLCVPIVCSTVCLRGKAYDPSGCQYIPFSGTTWLDESTCQSFNSKNYMMLYNPTTGCFTYDDTTGFEVDQGILLTCEVMGTQFTINSSSKIGYDLFGGTTACNHNPGLLRNIRYGVEEVYGYGTVTLYKPASVIDACMVCALVELFGTKVVSVTGTYDIYAARVWHNSTLFYNTTVNGGTSASLWSSTGHEMTISAPYLL